MEIKHRQFEDYEKLCYKCCNRFKNILRLDGSFTFDDLYGECALVFVETTREENKLGGYDFEFSTILVRKMEQRLKQLYNKICTEKRKSNHTGFISEGSYLGIVDPTDIRKFFNLSSDIREVATIILHGPEELIEMCRQNKNGGLSRMVLHRYLKSIGWSPKKLRKFWYKLLV